MVIILDLGNSLQINGGDVKHSIVKKFQYISNVCRITKNLIILKIN